MNPNFTDKLSDLSKWCSVAHIHHNQKHYSEALMNMRKSGEAFCKLILFYRHPGHYASVSSSGKSFRELIALVKKDIAPPTQIIHSLESLQIHGNMAVHDNEILSEQSALVLNSLRLLIRWLFDSFLKIPVQPEFNSFLKDTISSQEKKDSGKRNKEASKLREEKAELEKQIAYLKKNRQEDASRYEQLSLQIEKINESLLYRDTAGKEKETAETKYEDSQPIPASPSGKLKPKAIAYSLGAIILLAAMVLFTVKFLKTGTAEKDKTISANPALSNDSLYAVILPFVVIQDNPNINLKIEQYWIGKLQEGIKYYNLPMKLIVDNSYKTQSGAFSEMITYSGIHQCDVVVSGELFEQTQSEGNIINLRLILRKSEKMITQRELAKQKFGNLSDSNSTSTINHCLSYLNIAVADRYMNTGKASRALALLYQTDGIDQDGRGVVAKMMGQILMAQGNYTAAEAEAKKYCDSYPENAQGYSMLGVIYYELNKLKEAEKYFKKVIALKADDASTLTNLAWLYLKPEMFDREKCRTYALLALKYDSAFARAWLVLAQEEYVNKQYDEAMQHFYKCLSFDASFVVAHQRLASIYMEQKNDFDNTIIQLNEVLKLDADNVWALKSLGTIYMTKEKQDAAKAGYYLERAGKIEGDTGLMLKFHTALTTYKTDMKKALPLLLDYYRSDSSHEDINNSIINAYFEEKKFDSSFYYLNKLWQRDSFNYRTNSNFGKFYLNAPRPYYDPVKAIQYFEAALTTNPYEIKTMEILARTYFERGKLIDSKRISRRLYAIEPENKTASELFCLIYDGEDNLDSATLFYKRALKLFPEEDGYYSLYAMFLIKNHIDKNKDALSYAQEAVKINQVSPENHLALAKTLKYYHLNAQAREEYAKAVNMKPSLRSFEFEKQLEGN